MNKANFNRLHQLATAYKNVIGLDDIYSLEITKILDGVVLIQGKYNTTLVNTLISKRFTATVTSYGHVKLEKGHIIVTLT